MDFNLEEGWNQRPRSIYVSSELNSSEESGNKFSSSSPIHSYLQIAYLEVVIPPRIEDDQSSSDVAVPEGGSVKLNCKATGFPT